jgi:Chaperone of endosialidase
LQAKAHFGGDFIMAIVLSGSTGIQNPLGSASAPAESNTSNSNTGAYFPTGTTYAVATAGTNALYIDASQNVGIGTTSPTQKLHIKGGNNNTLAIDNDGSQYTSAYWKNNGTTVTGLYYDNVGTVWVFDNQVSNAENRYKVVGTGWHSFFSGGSERMRIDSSGNVGIGNTNPSSYGQLVVGNTSSSTQSFQMLTSAADFLIQCSSTAAGGVTLSNGWTNGGQGPLIFANSSTEVMRIDSSGNVGIGTTSPSAKLQVQGSQASGTANVLYLDNSSVTGTTLASVSFSNAGNVKASIAACVAGDGYMTFSNNNNSEKMRLDANGNLLVGVTTAQSGITTDPVGVSIYGNGSGGSQGATVLVRNSSNSVLYLNNKTSGGQLASFYNGGNAVGSITSNGSTTTYGTTSDYRLKENVQPLANGLTTIGALKPVTYDWINNKLAGEGFLAHELQAVIPQAVSGNKDAVEEDGSIKPQTVDYSKIVVHLVAAIQELSAEVTALKAKVGA